MFWKSSSFYVTCSSNLFWFLLNMRLIRFKLWSFWACSHIFLIWLASMQIPDHLRTAEYKKRTAGLWIVRMDYGGVIVWKCCYRWHSPALTFLFSLKTIKIKPSILWKTTNGEKKRALSRIGFEPMPFRNSTWNWRLRPTRPSWLIMKRYQTT